MASLTLDGEAWRMHKEKVCTTVTYPWMLVALHMAAPCNAASRFVRR